MITIGTIARFSIVDRRLFHCEEADKISDALSKTIRQITLITLISETPTVEKAVITDVVLAALIVLVVLIVLAALIVLLTVLNIEDNMIFYSH
ncbi:MAG: hypothetical protein A4E49_01428 [Methanosaeta sp. PtaU1.Bin112]|nr:MAG: hypothetical protein A4E49_01428 [Methanosaeta sp. PtaU1.Bin112]